MLGEQALFINGPAGPIEALLYVPESNLPQKLVIMCHPHPLHQGTMNNKVVTTVCRRFKTLGYASIRFNFRGIGQSGGNYDQAKGEIEDCLAVLAYVQQHYPETSICLAGFSFGSYIAYQAAHRQSVKGLILIAPPVNHFSFVQGSPTCPYWVIQGEQDEIVPKDEVLTWVRAQQPQANYTEFSATDHFFHGKLLDLAQQLDLIIFSL